MDTCGIELPESIRDRQAAAHEEGRSLIYVAIDARLAGALELHPSVRPEAREVIAALRSRGLSLCIISGDGAAPTRHLADALGIERYFAEVLPQDKAALVKELQRDGRKVCFVGDGINDAIALKTASASVSLRGATPVATDTAQIVLMSGELSQLPHLFALAGDFASNIRVGTLTTFVPAALSIAGVFFLHFGIYASIVLFNVSLVAGVGNAMLPRLKKDEPQGDDSEGAARSRTLVPAHGAMA